MKKKSTNYSTPDAGGWKNVADDLFLAQFRGRPCMVCGETRGYYNGKTIRSMGHHLLSKELHRLYRYDLDNIITLCPKHHLGAEMSPHSHDTAAQAVFYDWLQLHCPDRYALFVGRRNDKFNKEWCYRDMYEQLGGEIRKEKDGKKLAMKYWKPKNHKKSVERMEG